MKKTTHYKGHRWTDEELKVLMRMWADDSSMDEMESALGTTRSALLKMVQKLRTNGIPLKRRIKGHVAGRTNNLWTQGEVEYVVRRRQERATADQIGRELGRTPNAVSSMIAKLRSEDVPVAMLGCGVRRLWDADSLRAVAMQYPDSALIDQT